MELLERDEFGTKVCNENNRHSWATFGGNSLHKVCHQPLAGSSKAISCCKAADFDRSLTSRKNHLRASYSSARGSGWTLAHIAPCRWATRALNTCVWQGTAAFTVMLEASRWRQRQLVLAAKHCHTKVSSWLRSSPWPEGPPGPSAPRHWRPASPRWVSRSRIQLHFRGGSLDISR